ncbi:hypothetical protein H6F93_12060 [Leptolyngbya sp. FACHB-671]|uniref:hypothetical protein n=1 Tax=Leptolyngbya sp. FACHB-671 TaxID=2692812 RepID=UPI00168A15A4|nr:hypothetical protein [Leptolyngbya sp. FACHB-671]MBD2068246.1 hypothetical protein [Leptolyngbya sp. FACHB-671]
MLTSPPSQTSKSRQSPSKTAAHKPAKHTLPEPLPADPSGKRLCETFPYRWQPIVADSPIDATEKAAWQTLTRYPLRPRTLFTLWQDAAQLVGVRFSHTTSYALIDLDKNGQYHPNQTPGILSTIRAALETIGIYRTIPIRSSWSGGLHLYIPLPASVPTFDLAVAIKHCLSTQELFLHPGQLEVFPNVKSYGKAGKTVEYNAHRLPLQPGSGSALLNDDLQPIRGNLEQFFQSWDTAAAGQDMEELGKALTRARKAHRTRRASRSNKIDSWKQDLQSEMEQGWTAYGQTNQLLKAIACYGVVFESLSEEALVHYVEEIATHCPGYSQWCRHQHEIGKRAEEWASAAENYYWALGTTPKRGQASQAGNNIVCFNRQRAEDAQSRIKAALSELEARSELPDGMTARMKAIAQLAKCSFTTLQKYKELWQPQEHVITPTEPASTTLPPPSETSTQAPKAAPAKELHTIPYMKGGALASDQLSSKLHLDRKGEGLGRGDESFPQAESLLSETTVSPNVSPPRTAQSDSSQIESAFESRVSDVTVGIRHQIKYLGWTVAQVQQFIADNFQGKRWAHLTQSELPLLLYRLWQVSSGEY